MELDAITKLPKTLYVLPTLAMNGGKTRFLYFPNHCRDCPLQPLSITHASREHAN